MNRVKVLVLLFVLVAPISIHAQVSSTITSIGIDAKVIAPITIENTGNVPLNFGTISRSSSSGTVTVPYSGVRTSTGGASFLGSSTYSAATFSVTGENSATFNITLPADGAVTLINGSNSMPLSGFSKSITGTPQLSPSGSASFTVGATITVAANQVAAEYTGSFAVTVAYQ